MVCTQNCVKPWAPVVAHDKVKMRQALEEVARKGTKSVTIHRTKEKCAEMVQSNMWSKSAGGLEGVASVTTSVWEGLEGVASVTTSVREGLEGVASVTHARFTKRTIHASIGLDADMDGASKKQSGERLKCEP